MELLRLTDFRLAGFLVSRGATFAGTDSEGREIVFLFQNEDEEAYKILVQYPGSQEHSYDSACKTMHSFVKMAVKRRGGTRRG